MTSPISSTGPRNTEVCSSESTEASSPTSQAARPPAKQDTATVEQWSGSYEPVLESSAGTNSSNPAAIQAQLAQERTDRALFSKVMGRLDGAIDEFANTTGKNRDAARQSIINRFVAKDDFMELAGKFPPGQVSAAIERRLRESNPALNADDTRELTRGIVSHLSEAVRTKSAQRMKSTVCARLRSAVKRFNDAAKDPAEIKRLNELLKKLESPKATLKDKEAAERLRAGLGLDAKQPVTEASLKAALTARASTMEKEATSMQEAGNSLYRRLLTHDIGSVFMKESHIQPGSWAEAAVRGVKARGERDEKEIMYAKIAASVALAGVTAGAGAGIALGMVGAAAVNAPSVMVAVHEVDGAAAGASAGTAAENAEEVARWNATVKGGEAVAATLAAGAVGPVLHRVPLAALHGIGGHVGGELAADWALSRGAHALEDEREAASGQDALQRSK